MKKLLFLLTITLFLPFANAHSHELPKPGELSFKNVPEQNILYVVHKESEQHIALSFAKLVAYYMKDSTPFTVVFPLMIIQDADNRTRVAIAYTGDAKETSNVKLDKLPTVMVASKIYKGSYEKIGETIRAAFREILATGQYVPKDGAPLRLLYWNSPDDNQPRDLITEIQIPVIKLQ